MSVQTQLQILRDRLADYRAGNRGMPTYAELVAIAGAELAYTTNISRTRPNLADSGWHCHLFWVAQGCFEGISDCFRANKKVGRKRKSPDKSGL
ncbi:hypothetical protein ACU4HD_02810 [Cupriavidus basilensis]